MHTTDKKGNRRPAVIHKLQLYSVFWAFLIIIFSGIIYIQIAKHSKLSAEIETLKQQIEEAASRQQVLQQTIDFNKSDKFIIDYAHKELDLVHANEVIIINDNYKSD